jgi:hypothetical protein
MTAAARSALVRVVAHRMGDRERLILAIVSFGLVTAVTTLIAEPRAFTGFSPYDDEGYMLIALDSFVSHGSLYDEVFTQYGPFYFQAWGGLFSLLGLEVTHDAGRTVTLVVWVLTGLASGWAVFRVTRSVALGAVVQMLVFTALGSLTHEPMHPGGIICLLLASIVLLASFVGRDTAPGLMWTLGMAVAALTLVKINVGIFALAAIVLVLATVNPLLSRRWLRLAVEVAFVATPLLLISAKIGEPWARDYAVHVAVAALAVVIALRANDRGRRSAEELWWLGGGIVAASIAILGAAIGSGTSLGGLVEGVVGRPLGQADAFAIPLIQPKVVYVFDAAGITAAIGSWYLARARKGPPSPVWASLTSSLSVVVGIVMALSVFGTTLPLSPTFPTGFQLSMLAFAWVAILPVRRHSRLSFVRLVLPPLAVLQALHAYPVAGSQVAWSAFLLIPVGALCLWNGVSGLAESLREPQERLLATTIGMIAALLLGGYVANQTLRLPLRDATDAHDAAVPLDLPGADSVRLGPPEAELYSRVARGISQHCSSVVMLPGMASFYLWTEMDPPTGYIATAWPSLFDPDDERKVIDDIRSSQGLCLLENRSIARAWSGGTIPVGPLVSHMRREFEPIARFGTYRLLKRRSDLGSDA